MGQINHCTMPNPPKSTTLRETTTDVRRNLNPLHYIPPIPCTFEQPNSISHNEPEGKTSSHRNSFNSAFGKTGSVQSDPTAQHEIQKQEEFSESQKLEDSSEEKQIDPNQIIYKKIEVKWNKFIKMKRKDYTIDYSVIKEIGRGGFGCVYKVELKNTRILRAAKKIQKKNLAADQHQSLLAEMALMMHMDHPNITKLYEVYDEKSHYVLILELCEGGELFERIVQNHKITENEAKDIMRQILSALHYLHTKGIVHRDIKPENMLFQKSTKLIKMIDFGISTKLQPNKYLTTRVGTPYYIAPQILSKRYNEKCDIWSVGVVMYMMIYSVPPFRGSSPNAVMNAIITEDIAFRSPVPFKFTYQALDFLKLLLNRNPLKRPSAKTALQHSWLAEKQETPIPSVIQETDKVLQRITKFHFKNKLQAVVYTYIVSQLLTSQERLDLLGVFQRLDVNKNGIIQVNQLSQALAHKQFFKCSSQKIKLIKQYLDTNCSGSIDYTEFLVGGMDFKEKITDNHLEQAFRYFDIDNSGEITFEEVNKFLENEGATKDQIQELFKLVDKNGDGVISKLEFLELLAQKKLEINS